MTSPWNLHIVSAVRWSAVRGLVVAFGLTSLAEVLRQLLYGLPFGPLLSVGWAVVVALLLGAIARQRSDRWLAGFAWALPLADAASVAGAFLAIDKGQATITVLLTALTLSLPLMAVAILAWRLNPAIGHPFRILRIPAPAVAVVAGLTVAAEPARQMVEVLPIGEPRMEFVAEHAGCFELGTRPWSPLRQPGHAILTPSRFVRLDTVLGPKHMPGDRAGGAAFEGEKPLIRPGWVVGAAYWAPFDRDRLVLTWNTGLHGTRVVLRRAGTGYRGRAISWTDVIDGSPSPRTVVTATPVSCDHVPPDSARMPGALQRAMDRYEHR